MEEHPEEAEQYYSQKKIVSVETITHGVKPIGQLIAQQPKECPYARTHGVKHVASVNKFTQPIAHTHARTG